ncbi:MAG: SDR family NAD(P)-dependent oxidoreductase, partial [Thiomargarita sp.]|nr:SDR family NAD(P)-dependent oxidoreductase [Thiomargarita sp.]
MTAIAQQYGSIGAFILMTPSSQNLQNTVLGRDFDKNILKSAFLIAKHLKKSLNDAAKLGRSWFITVTHGDGALGVSYALDSIISGGLFGLTKTVNMEWGQVFCRAINLSLDLNPDTAAQHIIAELFDPNQLLTEVGCSLQGRVTLAGVDNPLPFGPVKQVNTNAVFLVSGGGRGITAQCVIKMAQNFQCKFILLGRTQRIAEPEYALGCTEEKALKQKIIQHLKAQGDKPTPIKVQKLSKSIFAQREIESTVQGIIQAGGQAEYLGVDITNASDLQQQLSRVTHLGTITGIIHGAGVLADKLIEKKTEQEFELVYTTKIQGLQSMLACVNESTLEHLILFSSAAGFYGNIGQSDYSIANEILNKFAHYFKQQHPTSHVVSFNWGPWDGGMVTAQLKEMFAQRNIDVIPIEVGTQMVVDNLRTGEAIQLLVGSPFSPEIVPLKPELHTYRIHRHLTLEDNPFIQDHVIGGNAVVPVTCATAWMINSCEQMFGGYQFFGCNDIKVFKGIIFDNTLVQDYIVDVKETDKTTGEDVTLAVTLWSKTAQDKPQYHYSAQVILKKDIPDAPTYDNFDTHVDDTLADLSLYEDGTLFHGPCFQGIKRVLNISPEKLTIECVFKTVSDKERGQFPRLTLDPVAADAQFQFMLVWVRHFHQAASLPLRCDTAEHFKTTQEGKSFYVSLDVQSHTDSKLVATITTHDAEGMIYSRISGAEVTISKQLNHLFVPSNIPDPHKFLPFWRHLLNTGEWAGELLFTALFKRFVKSIVFENPADFQSLKGTPVLYLANHQVGVESILFGLSLSALSEYPINVVAKTEHQKSWINQLSTRTYAYPGLTHPELMFYFDRADQFSMLKLLANIKTV